LHALLPIACLARRRTCSAPPTPPAPALQVVLEMIELREIDTARAMLRQTQVFQKMKHDDGDRCGARYYCAALRAADRLRAAV
jgi:hypothetical protein